MTQQTATFTAANERIYVLRGGFETRAFVRDGVCVRSIVTSGPERIIVQTHAGERMIDDLAGVPEATLIERGYQRLADRTFWIGPRGREFNRMEDGGYICDVDDGEDGYQIVYDATGQLIS